MGFLYYSTQTRLAHRVSVRYYNSQFYVYCSDQYDPPNPGSSSPAELYETYRKIAADEDQGHPKFSRHKEALRQVAKEKYQNQKINQTQYRSLLWEIENAPTNDFIPYLYLILKSAVQRKTAPVPVTKRASPNAEEYIIKNLRESAFEVIKSRIQPRGGI